MNKQELIEKYQYRLYEVCTNYGDYYTTIAYENILKDLERLDESKERVTIPWFIADWIVQAKKDGYNIAGAIHDAPKGEVDDWLELANVDIFAEAWVNGYEVEKEKRYLVKIIGIKDYDSYLNYRKEEEVWTIESKMEVDAIRTGHTLKELEEAGFGWVFDCEGIEIEEVTE
jgi:hypothetical protein